MISFGIIFVLFIGTTWTKSVDGLPYSKVFVQSGPDLVPFEYVSYGPPSVAVPGSAVAQLAAAPIGQLVPCVGKCVPGQQFVPIQTPTAKLVTYKGPAPVVVTPTKDDLPVSYQYSYVVYDENTGDQKTQTELSDGSFVQGQYSLIQPDGFVREVLYTADDLKGFNAVVKNFLPKAEDIAVKKPEGQVDPCKPPEKPSDALIELTLDAVSNTQEPKVQTEPTSTEKPETEIKEVSSTESIEIIEPAQKEEEPVSNDKDQPTEIKKTPEPGLLSYNDIIKCLQAALQNKNALKTTSPITYIILNKPC